MATQETFDRTIAILKDAKFGHVLFDVQVGICLGEPRLQPWTRDLGTAKQVLRVNGWIVGQADAHLSFAVVSDDPVVEAATPELALVIAALVSRKAELLEQG